MAALTEVKAIAFSLRSQKQLRVTLCYIPQGEEMKREACIFTRETQNVDVCMLVHVQFVSLSLLIHVVIYGRLRSSKPMHILIRAHLGADF